MWIGFFQRDIILRVKEIPDIIEWLYYEPNMIQESCLHMTNLLRCIDENLRTEGSCDEE